MPEKSWRNCWKTLQTKYWRNFRNKSSEKFPKERKTFSKMFSKEFWKLFPQVSPKGFGKYYWNIFQRIKKTHRCLTKMFSKKLTLSLIFPQEVTKKIVKGFLSIPKIFAWKISKKITETFLEDNSREILEENSWKTRIQIRSRVLQKFWKQISKKKILEKIRKKL